MSESENKVPLPLWARLLLGFLIAAIMGWLSLGAAGAYWLASFQKQAVDPIYIEQTLRQIADIQSLPSGFERVAAFSVPAAHTHFVLLRHTPDGSEYWLIRMPDAGSLTARQIVDQGVKLDNNSVASMSDTKRGSRQVAGEEFDWVQGAATTLGGASGQQLIGVIVLNKQHESVRIIAVTPGNKFDMKDTDQLLDSIKGF